jgi:uncharacterized protein (DUF427 family)
MNATRSYKTPGPDHPMTVVPSSAHVVVRRGSVVMAETDRALELREASYPVVYYVPVDDVDQRRLRPSELHTWCPYKGEASYFDVGDGDEATLPDAIWYYDDPFPAVAEIKGHVAFYADKVTVTVSPDRPTVE